MLAKRLLHPGGVGLLSLLYGPVKTCDHLLQLRAELGQLVLGLADGESFGRSVNGNVLSAYTKQRGVIDSGLQKADPDRDSAGRYRLGRLNE
ncbi:hypothetical protein D3C73_1433650 [compost metagenome]